MGQKPLPGVPADAERDSLGAFRRLFQAPLRLERSDGPLQGLRFGAKDLFDVEGFVTGAGNPDWEKSHPPAGRTAAVIQRLLKAGAALIGKTHTDELAYSVNGENAHFGTPINPRAPGRIPGGSSSGSASAVAGHAVDFALGTDTSASVRIPASFCGLYGIRPTHGLVSTEGCIALGPTIDTVGWFADDYDVFRKVAQVLLPSGGPTASSAEWIVADGAFQLCDPAIRAHFEAVLKRIADRFGLQPVALNEDLAQCAATLRTLLGYEAWQTHREWIADVRPRFGPGVKERFAWAGTVTHEDYRAATVMRGEVRERFAALLQDTRILLWPTAPCIAPPLALSAEALDPIRKRILSLTSVASLCGFPQVTIPIGTVDACPIGLSLIGAPGSDLVLLDRIAALSPVLVDGRGAL